MGNLAPVFDDLAAKEACACVSCCTACVRFIVIFMQTQCINSQPMYQTKPSNPATKSVVNDLIYSIYPVSKLTLSSSDNTYTHTCTCTRKRNSSSLYSSDSVSVKTLYSIDS
jgi:hypothetical protein